MNHYQYAMKYGPLLFRFPLFLSDVLFLFQDRVWDTTLRLLIMSPRLLLVVTISKTSLYLKTLIILRITA